MNIDSIRDFWDDQSPEKKTFILKYGIAILVITFIVISYYFTGRDEMVVEAEPTVNEMQLGTDLLEDDIRSEVESKLTEQDEVNLDDDKRLLALENLMLELQNKDAVDRSIELGSDLDREELNTEIPDSKIDKEQLTSIAATDNDIANESSNLQNSLYPEPPPLPLTTVVFPENNTLESNEPLQMQYVGSIGRSGGIPVSAAEEPLKKNNQFLMPPGFMKAKLLTGVDAMTASQGKQDGEPLMFRVQAPAILPNDLKADLKGCFVIGNGYGSLAKERIDVRLVSMHCVSHDGTGVIDEKIKGWVTGKDGKKGIPAVVVTRAGSLIARSFVAGAFDGIGSAVSLDTVTQSISPLGSTQVIDAEQALQAGIGQGIKSGSEKIQDLYLEWARQSGPVLETGAAADCTIVIQESVSLKVQDWAEDNNAES